MLMHENSYRKSRFALFGAIALLLATQASWAASKTEIDARVKSALTAMYEREPASRELMAKAAGVLVFPRVLKGAAGIGAEVGEGALLINGNTVEYYRVAALSFGFQLGGQAKTEVIMFMTNAALQEFRQSDGWEAGIDGNVALIEFGVGKGINTHTMRDPIVGFVFDNRGLMYDLSLEGSKFWKIQKG